MRRRDPKNALLPRVEAGASIDVAATGSGTARSELKSVREVMFESYFICELENGSIEVERDEGQGMQSMSPVQPVLRELAKRLNLPLVNANSNPYNTRQLGSLVIKSVVEASVS